MVDVSKPITNPALLEAMEAMQNNPSPEAQALFLKQLSTARFLMVLSSPLSAEPPDSSGNIVLNAGSTLSFPTLVSSDKRPLHFGFTDWDNLRKWRSEENQQTLIVPFSELPAFILREGFDCAGFILNPASHNVFLPKELIAQLTANPVPCTVEQATKVLLGEPKNHPHALEAAVKEKLKSLRDVKRAWLMLMQKEQEQSYLIVLEHKGSRKAISKAVGKAASAHLPPGMFVDIATTDQDFGKDAVKNRKPFFKRGIF